MKATIAAIVLSTCLLGLTTAAPGVNPKAPAPVNKEAAAKPAPAAKTARPMVDAKKAEEARKSIALRLQRVEAAKKAREAAVQKKAEGAMKVKNAEACKKTADPKKAAEAVARKKADDERKAKEAVARRKALGEQKARAEAERKKAADALKAADKKVATINAECRRIDAEKAQREALARRKTEFAKKHKAMQAAAQERAMIARMESDIRELNREVERLSQQLASARPKADPPKKARK